MPHSSSHYPIHSSRHDSSSRRPPTSSQSHSQTDRARYWQTILGGQPGSDDHSNTIYNSPSSSVTTPYSSSSRSKSSSPTSSRKRLHMTSLNLDSSRSARSPPPKPFACQQCERRFERIGHLRSHVDAVHNLRQPYVCHYNGCGKTFSHRSSLCRHVKGVHEKHRHHDKSRSSRQLPPVANPYGFQGFIGTRS